MTVATPPTPPTRRTPNPLSRQRSNTTHFANSKINTASTPNLNAAYTGGSMAPSTPAGGARRIGSAMTPKIGSDNTGPSPEVGDTVDVPGGMHGTVKFVGRVKGKPGVFAGVELAREYAGKGKNNGDVDGTSYFKTSIAGSGIFLPLNKASKRASPATSSGSFPPTPTTPSLSAFNIGGRAGLGVTPSLPKFSQSVGPGRAASPALKPRAKRAPSLQRPESPLRKTQGPLPGLAGRPSLGAGKKLAFTPKSRLGPESSFDEEAETTPIGVARTTSDISQEEVKRLKSTLEERDRQLKDQAASLAEMEKQFTELQALLLNDERPQKSKHAHKDSGLPEDAVQLRALLREKNEKIAMLTAEFDNHRADFRSTIDTLEMASTETERVYEKRVDELLQEVRELQDRGEDVESVARQLKQLEELVQELEEGLEDARRGEAEARGEVEFLRGEVERGRSELKREREKAAAALKGAGAAVDTGSGGGKDLEQRDDEIRGLKAIIHSLSRDSMLSESPDGRRSSNHMNGSQTNGFEHDDLDPERVAQLERQIRELEGLVDRKTYREEELERENERLRGFTGPLDKHKSASTVGSHRLSDRTVVPGDWRDQAMNESHPGIPRLETMHESDTGSSVTDGSALWCEICETGGHDILTCTNMFGNQDTSKGKGSPNSQRTGRDVVMEGLKNQLAPSPRTSDERDRVDPLDPMKRSPVVTPIANSGAPMPNPMDQGMVAGKASGIIDETKWCALCERDGHESVDCPFEDAF